MSEREAISQLRRWCPEAETHQDEDDPWCGWEHGDVVNHRLRVHRMLVCSECDMAFFTKGGFDEHECYSAY